jgi:hypothetical protein
MLNNNATKIEINSIFIFFRQSEEIYKANLEELKETVKNITSDLTWSS